MKAPIYQAADILHAALLTVLVLLSGSILALTAAPARADCVNMAVNSDGLWQFNPGLCPNNPSRPPKSDVWGAIAVSPSLSFGNAMNYKSQAAAEAAALKKCKDAGCRVAASVADVCIALAISRPEKISRVGGPIGAGNFADHNADLLCRRAGGKSCQIATSLCADGERHNIQGANRASLGKPVYPPQPAR